MIKLSADMVPNVPSPLPASQALAALRVMGVEHAENVARLVLLTSNGNPSLEVSWWVAERVDGKDVKPALITRTVELS